MIGNGYIRAIFVFLLSDAWILGLISGNPVGAERPILIDADPGVDDAWAFFMALQAHKAAKQSGFNIVAVSTVNGNARLKDVNQNLARILKAMDVDSIPVYSGAGEFLLNPFKWVEEPPFFGEDGFGEAGLPPAECKLEPEHAALGIIKEAEKHKGELTIVALGPLTNLALAYKLKPEIKDQIKEIYILGGNMDGVGNAKVAAEFNFVVDPEAASIVLQSYKNLIIMPLETFVKYGHPLEYRVDTLGKIESPQIKMQNAVEKSHLERVKKLGWTWVPADAILMACAVNPKIMKETKDYFGQVELAGTITRGMMHVDKLGIAKHAPNVKLITQIDHAEYEKYIKWAAGGESAV